VPFHEHPRFKELIEERKQLSEQTRQMQEQLEEMRRATTQKQEQAKAHPFVQKLTEIDPSYGEWAGGVEQIKAQLAELAEWKREQANQSLVKDYESTIDKLHAENKVPEELKARIRQQLDFQAMSNPKLGMKDLPSIYKTVFESESKFMESIKRSERASYVADKSRDASAPSSQGRGKPVSPNQKAPTHKDVESAYASIVAKSVRNSRAGNDI